MLNVLINAYAVAPNWGSEQGMGWNWVSNLARFCNLHIITEGEWQKEIEESLEAALRGDMRKEVNPTGLTREQAEHMHFYYLPVTPEVREMCWNQGSWKFYVYYEQWERRALEKAKEIIAELKAADLEENKIYKTGKTSFEDNHNSIDLVHKLNMIGYREPGYLWKIEDLPYVWGPVGGYGSYPYKFMEGYSVGLKVKTLLKNVINYFEFRWHPRVRKAMIGADAVIGAYKEAWNAIKKVYNPEAALINETGAFVNSSTTAHRSEQKEFRLIWVGKYDMRKQLGVAIKTMSLLKDKSNIHLYVLGSGYQQDVECYSQMVKDLGVDNTVHLLGKVANTETKEMMASSDLFFFTSIADATSTVVPEAIGVGLPIVCHNACGFGVIVDDRIGRKVEVRNPEYSAQEFARIISDLEEHRDVVRQLSANCIERQKEISWEANARKMVEEYEKAIKHFNDRRSGC